jgi:hypothetical protein
MDESGDLGFDTKKNNSAYFVVSFLVIPDKKFLEKTIVKIIADLKHRKAKIIGGILHSTKEKPNTRRKLLTLVSFRRDVSLFTIVVKKSTLPLVQQNDIHQLYTAIVSQ